jgi:hypothetical protein
MNQTIAPTKLEQALLQLYYETYGPAGFPSPHEIHVIARENTGVGRRVDLLSDAPATLTDGWVALGDHYVNLPGVPDGVGVAVLVKSGRPVQMELTAFGFANWNGNEDGWTIL